MKAQRERLYTGMENELRKQVADLAAKQNIPIVLGYYIVNTNCQDLTDQVLKSMAQ